MKKFEFYLLYLLANFMRLYLDCHTMNMPLGNLLRWEKFTKDFVSRIEDEYKDRK